MVANESEALRWVTRQWERSLDLYLASVTQRLRLQLYDLNYGAIQIILLTYLLRSDQINV